LIELTAKKLKTFFRKTELSKSNMNTTPEIIYHYFNQLTENQKNQIEKLLKVYTYWNAQINVISRKDFDNFYTHHVLHSLAIAKLISFQAGSQILDIGTGGGFPGIPLAILFPDTHFHLTDSIGKKIKVVKEVAKLLALENVKATHARVETLSGGYDFITARAVAPATELIQWTKSLILNEQINELPNGWLFLKGGDLSEELESFQNVLIKKPIADFFEEPFFEEKYVLHLAKI
jgi:16S rRNA (guanine527-N7)-methyltransferase